MRSVIVAGLCSVLLGGCGTLVKDRSQVPVSPVGGFGTAMGSPKTIGPNGPNDTAWRNADVITLDLPLLIGRYAGTQPHVIEVAFADFDAAGTADQRAERRNAIVGAVIMASDKNCDVYLEYLHGNQIAIKGISSAAATIFSGAAAITTPARSSSLLAALGSASTGVGGNLSEAVFSNRAVEVIVSGIRAERAALRNEMEDRMASVPYGAWPLPLAIGDGLKYHGRCNAISGLAYLQGTAEANKAISEAPGSPAAAVATDAITPP
jgi:uncharacterized protein YceK